MYLLSINCFAIRPQPGQQMRDLLLVQWPAGVEAKPVGKLRIKVRPDVRDGANVRPVVLRQRSVFRSQRFLKHIIGTRSAGRR
ncbi:hypothetical protein [Rhodopila globiformis]|uniref:Uncharacterized protein n=1 Tax=Rhodopila globiformis TaxID=1071 RepID=A0A2S6NI12_RHOGL|nr:hypothetical protein [Rhodopila globiformis]PPQ34240.1 hypothetical protein CCS01_11855 [Rhodopila globiformis]